MFSQSDSIISSKTRKLLFILQRFFPAVSTRYAKSSMGFELICAAAADEVTSQKRRAAFNKELQLLHDPGSSNGSDSWMRF